MNVQVPAIIVGFALNGLGIARSLAPMGVDCYILFNEPDDPCLKTKYGNKIQVDGIAAEDILPVIKQIKEATGERPVLFLTNDFTVDSISKNRELFEGLVRFPLPDHDLVDALLQKDRCRDLYERASIDQPDTACLTQGEDDTALDGLRYPCILKASEKPDGYNKRFKKAYIVEQADEAREIFASMRGFVDRVVVQEWIDGQDTDIFFGLTIMSRDGGVAAAFCGKKIDSWPPRMGNTARCAPAPDMEEQVIAATTRFFKSAGLIGFGALEFKRDGRDGRLCAIEPTVFRADYQAEIATLNGINLPFAFYCLATEQECPKMTASAKTGWSDPVYMARLGGIWRRLAKRPALPMKDAYWRWNDPLPWLMLRYWQLVSPVRGAARRIGGAIKA